MEMRQYTYLEFSYKHIGFYVAEDLFSMDIIQINLEYVSFNKLKLKGET